MAEKLPTESLDILLTVLDRDAITYEDLFQTLLRFFILRGDREPERATDEVLDRVALKLGQGVEIQDLKKYSFGVARFVFLERLKRDDKERKAAKGYYENNALHTEDASSERFAILRRCFQALLVAEQSMLRKYFQDLKYEKLMKIRDEIAAELHITQNNLRLKIFRLRRRLEKCVKESQ